MALKLYEHIGNRDNNFNLIRFIAASLVIIGHSYPLVLGKGNWDPFHDISGGLTFGTLAVDIFFITSGFLITGSLLTRKKLLAFFWARFLRIYPALTVAILFSVFIIGLLFTTETLFDYLSSTEVSSFIVKDISLVWKLGYYLPGVFEGNPYPGAVNGSLWTLPWEIRMYFLLALFGFVFKFELKKSVVAIVLTSAVILFAFKLEFLSESKNLQNLFRFITFFFTGSIFFLYQKKISLDHKIFLLSVSVLFISLFFNKSIFYLTYICTLAYIILYIAYVPGGLIRKFNYFGDYSYGIYIYAFPIQQSFIILYPESGIWDMALFTWLVSFFIATMSWHFIEKPALERKNDYIFLENILTKVKAIALAWK